MHMIQYSHGVLVESDDVTKHLTKPLPTFNPPAESLPVNPMKLKAKLPKAAPEPVQVPVAQPIAPVESVAPAAADPFTTPVKA
jgi:hypothetical protein